MERLWQICSNWFLTTSHLNWFIFVDHKYICWAHVDLEHITIKMEIK